MSTTDPQLEKSESVSSTSDRHVTAPTPPARPSKSASALTVRTLSNAAGLYPPASTSTFPADTANATPPFTADWIASRSAWLNPGAPRLMLATSIVPEFAATQSTPRRIQEMKPVPAPSSTFTDHSRLPGATPTTPTWSSSAPMIPATWVPCCASSSPPATQIGPTVQSTPPATFRSGCCRSMPPSSTATSTSTRTSSTPSMSIERFPAAKDRDTPVGTDWASIDTLTSRST